MITPTTKTFTYDTFADNDDSEYWTDDIEDVIKTRIEYDCNQDWKPLKGMTITIAQGVKNHVTWEMLAPDIEDHIHEALYQEVGEVAQNMEFPKDLQANFEAWLESTIGPQTFYQVSNICELDLIYTGDEWIELGDIKDSQVCQALE